MIITLPYPLGLVRGNKGALEKFNELDGYNVVVRSLQSPVPKLQLKSLFLLSSICLDAPDQCKVYNSMGVPQQVKHFLSLQYLLVFRIHKLHVLVPP